MLRHRCAGIAGLCVLIFAAASLRLSAHALSPSSVTEAMDVPPIPGNIARPLSFGFRSLLADLTFIEAIQTLALRRSGFTAAQSKDLDRRLLRLLEYSVELDPKFAGAYRFSGAALPHETVDGKAMGVLAAVQILEQGVRERPDDWHIPFLLGFLQAYYLRAYAQASVNLGIAARDQGAPAYLGLLATRVAAQGGQLSTALALAESMLAQATEDETRRLWDQRVRTLRMEQDLQRIEAAAARYKADHGSFPASIRDLAAAGYLPREPAEPHGGRYLLSPGGTARSSAAERLRLYGGAPHLEVH